MRPAPARGEPQERRPSESAAASNDLAGAVSSLGPSSRRNGRASSEMGRASPGPPRAQQRNASSSSARGIRRAARVVYAGPLQLFADSCFREAS